MENTLDQIINTSLTPCLEENTDGYIRILNKAEDAVNKYLTEEAESHELVKLGLPPKPLKLCYSLNTREIDYSLDLMESQNIRLVLSKRYHQSGVSIYYYKHTNNIYYTVSIHDNDMMLPTVC